MDRFGNLYFGFMEPIAIGCWNINTPYDKHNIKVVSENYETLQFASGVKIVINRLGEEELWVITCRFQKVLNGNVNLEETNFRVLAIPTNQLLDAHKRCIGTPLATSPFFGYGK